MDINLNEYQLVMPEYIKKISNNKVFYDIEVEDQHNFFITDENGSQKILTHNCDGIGHIASLLINLFWRWFPSIIKEDKLKILITPLISADSNGQTEYFYNAKNYQEWAEEGHKISNIRYLKGLGSLSPNDWDFVMEYRDSWTVYNDKAARKMLDIAFGKSSNLRKQWLRGDI